MKQSQTLYDPVEGKTYSLFGKTRSTSGYYETIKMLADRSLELVPDMEKLIGDIHKFSKSKRRLKRNLKKLDKTDIMSAILNLTDSLLQGFTTKAEEHLRTLSVSKRFDAGLATSREQYHLYMLEIELTNRLNKNDFLNSDRKIALTPYCLQDFSTECKSARNGFDYQCRRCSGNCFQNHASEVLRAHNIEPFIWMEGDLKQLAKYTLTQNQTLGVIGIACIPELTSGMRDCRNRRISVVGLPLNANRCKRWFGEFFPNSVDLDELNNLLSV